MIDDSHLRSLLSLDLPLESLELPLAYFELPLAYFGVYVYSGDDMSAGLLVVNIIYNMVII